MAETGGRARHRRFFGKIREQLQNRQIIPIVPTDVLPPIVQVNDPAAVAPGLVSLPTSSSTTSQTSRTTSLTSTSTSSSTTSSTASSTSETSSSSSSTTSSTTSSRTTSSSTTSSLSTSTTFNPIYTPPSVATTFTFVTPSPIPDAASSAAVVGPSVTATSSATNSTGAIVGGVIAGLVALLGLVAAAIFLMRRGRNNNGDFDAAMFRNQSSPLPEDDRASQKSRNPRPPTMIERKINPPPPIFATYTENSAHSPYPSPSPYVQQYPQPQPQFQMLDGQAHLPPPRPAFYVQAQAPFSPMGHTPPSSPFFHSPMESDGVHLMKSSDSASVVWRESATTVQSDNNEHYVDLNRATLTPFQAQQYEEIHRRLNEGVYNERGNTSLDTIATGHATSYSHILDSHKDLELPPVPVDDAHSSGDPPSRPDSPPLQVDPVLPPVNNQDKTVDIPEDPLPVPSPRPESPSSKFDPILLPVENNGQYFEDVRDSLRAPSPAVTRIASVPPVLPELRLQNRFTPMSYDFLSAGTLRASPAPSPLAVSFSANISADGPVAKPPDVKRRDTVYSAVFDEADAYGGI